MLLKTFQSSSRLALIACPRLDDEETLEQIASLQNLSYLDLSSTSVSDVSPLEKLKKLQIYP